MSPQSGPPSSFPLITSSLKMLKDAYIHTYSDFHLPGSNGATLTWPACPRTIRTRGMSNSGYTTKFFAKVSQLKATFTLKNGTLKYGTFYDYLEDAMIETIFNSNFIEQAGLSLRLTADICRSEFRGHDVKAEDVDERDTAISGR